MAFEVYEVALELVRAIRNPLASIERRDPALAQQLRRAVASVPLNIAEGRRRAGKDRLHHWRVAAGSADEVRASLQVAEALGLVRAEDIAGALDDCDRVLAMAWRLTQ